MKRRTFLGVLGAGILLPKCKVPESGYRLFRIENLKFPGYWRPYPQYVAALEESIKNLGLLRPILVGQNMEILDGVLRTIAMRNIGREYILGTKLDAYSTGKWMSFYSSPSRIL